MVLNPISDVLNTPLMPGMRIDYALVAQDVRHLTFR